MTRGGVFAASVAVGALIVTGAFIFAPGSDANAQAKKKEAPLDIKDDASPRPWKRYGNWPQRDMSKFNTLVNLASPPAPTEPRKLTGPITGNAENGAKFAPPAGPMT